MQRNNKGEIISVFKCFPEPAGLLTLLSRRIMTHRERERESRHRELDGEYA